MDLRIKNQYCIKILINVEELKMLLCKEQQWPVLKIFKQIVIERIVQLE